MATSPGLVPPEPHAAPRRCYTCFRKADDCFCAVIPRIDNRISLLILQHVRERFHPFNTARIVRKSLVRSRLLVMHDRRQELEGCLESGAALLYPGPGATLLTELPADQFPQQLVVVDGTWSQARTLVRDYPILARLPRYGLAPTSPSRYRIRREPTATALSTVEATIAALRVLEPETLGFDQLLAAFDTMVERQLAHPKSVAGWRRHDRGRPTAKNIPSALLGDLRNVVACYGESAPKDSGARGALFQGAPPLSWVAERLGTGERFARLIRPNFPLEDALLGHLALDRRDFEQAVPFDEARRAWSEFIRPDDVPVVYSPGVGRLVARLGAVTQDCLVLKSVQLGTHRRGSTLDELLLAEGLTPPAPAHPGRGGQRLANLIAWVRYLNGFSGQGRE